MDSGGKRSVLIFALIFGVISESILPRSDPVRLFCFKDAFAAVFEAVFLLIYEGTSQPERACFRRGLLLSVKPSWTPFAEILSEADFSEPFYCKPRKWRPEVLIFLSLDFENREYFWKGLGD